MRMSEPLEPNLSASMSSAADSPARTSAMPVCALALTANDPACGARWPASLANYDRATSSWRTSQRCLDGDWAAFSETWPRSGMTRNGIGFPLQPLAPIINGTESGSWPTPRAYSFGESHRPGLTALDIRVRGLYMDQARYWPTIRSSDGERGGRGDLIQAVRGNPNSHYRMW